MIVDPAQHIGEPGLRIDIVQPGGRDESVEGGGALAAAIGAGEGPIPAPEGNPSERALGGVVAEADAAVFKETGE